MQEETLVAFLQNIVYKLLIELCSERTSGEGEGFTTLEKRTSVGHWERRDLAPNGSDVRGLTTIEALSFVKNTATHGITHHIFIVTVGLCVLLFKVFF